MDIIDRINLNKEINPTGLERAFGRLYSNQLLGSKSREPDGFIVTVKVNTIGGGLWNVGK
jgi:hypothetical protein